MKNYKITDILDNISELYDTGIETNGNASEVSVVITTYNRCSSLEIKENPLFWSISSLLNEKSVKEVIIVDDYSNDFTKYTFDQINKMNENCVTFKYIKNPARMGTLLSRKNGINIADCDRIFIMDDDAVLIKRGSIDAISANEDKIIQMPVYYRDTVPTNIKNSNEIGGIDLKKGVITSNFDSFPENSIQEFNNSNNHAYPIFHGFHTKNLQGTFLADKEIASDMEVFKFPWAASWGSETIQSLVLIGKGYKIKFIPDPRTGVLHFKYGWLSEKKPSGRTDIVDKFDFMLEKSNKQVYNSGCRLFCGNENLVYNWTINKIAAQYLISKIIGTEEIYREYMTKKFIQENDSDFYRGYGKIDSKTKRKEAFENGRDLGEQAYEKFQPMFQDLDLKLY